MKNINTPNVEDIDHDIEALYREALAAMDAGDEDTANTHLKEAVRLSTFHKRLNDARTYLRKRGQNIDPTQSMSNTDRTAELVEWLGGAKAKATYLKNVEDKARRKITIRARRRRGTYL